MHDRGGAIQHVSARWFRLPLRVSEAFKDDDGIKQHYRSDGREDQVFHKCSFLLLLKIASAAPATARQLAFSLQNLLQPKPRRSSFAQD